MTEEKTHCKLYPEAIERKDMHKRRLILIWGLSIWAASQTYQRAYASDGAFSGVSYSFTQDHPDFGVPSCGLSYGNMAGLDVSGRPAYGGAGHKIVQDWTQIVGGTGVMPLAPNLFGAADEACGAVVEKAGEAGPADGGGVTSADTFAQWYRPVLGVNQTWTVTLEDQDPIEGRWGMSDPNFKPAGVQGNLYTVALAADFVYWACESQEFEISFRGDAWAFVDTGSGAILAIDMGGTNHSGAWQSIDLDRLGLNDGETYRLRIFLAHRTNGAPADLAIRAEGMALAPVAEITIGGVFD